VKGKVKRCVAGQFRTVAIRVVSRRRYGPFAATFRLAARGFLFVRAYDAGVSPAARSDEQYVRILGVAGRTRTPRATNRRLCARRRQE
jgi:hypothetical protein